MKNLAILLCLSLMLLPVIWNGIGLWHYVMEHTHTFCAVDSVEHSHQTSEDCVSICQLINTTSNQQLPITNDYYELKTCITSTPFFNTLLLSSSNQSNFIESHLKTQILFWKGTVRLLWVITISQI